MEVPYIDLRSLHVGLVAPLQEAVRRVMNSGVYVLGPEVHEFETELAQHVGVGHAVGVASGSDALTLALMALDVGPGDEVITTPFAPFAAAGAIARLGATPRFVDIDPGTFHLDPGQIAAALSTKTRAIIPVHLFGRAVDIDALVDAADGIPVVEDLAHALGARDSYGHPTGTGGICGTTSFYPTRNLGALGNGGAILTNNSDLAGALRRLRVNGSRQRYWHDRVGLDSRLDALQAAMLRVMLPHLPGWIEAREMIAQRYHEHFQEADLPESVKLPVREEVERHAFNHYVVRVPERDAVLASLHQRGVEAAVPYPVPLHLQLCFQGLRMREGALPEAERASREVLSLPIYPGLTDAQQRSVVHALVQSVSVCTAELGVPF